VVEKVARWLPLNTERQFVKAETSIELRFRYRQDLNPSSTLDDSWLFYKSALSPFRHLAANNSQITSTMTESLSKGVSQVKKTFPIKKIQGQDLLIDAYYVDSNTAGPRPAILFFHGGFLVRK
jgi:acetyl esterase/lipase